MDEAGLRALNALAEIPAIATAAVVLSSPWLFLAAAPYALRLLWRRRFVAVASLVLATGLGEALSVRVVKPLVDRSRPCHALAGLALPAGCGPGESFPSGHATTAAALGGATLGHFGRTAAPLVLLAGLVGVSRIFLGVHYPSDVLAGALLGLVVGLAAARASRRLEPPG